MKKLLVAACFIFVGCHIAPAKRQGQVTDGVGVIENEHCSIVITPNAIIISKDSLLYNVHSGHTSWVPVVHVIEIKTGINTSDVEKNLDSLMTVHGFEKEQQ